jgi:Ca2+-binding RTX toxin-like protein
VVLGVLTTLLAVAALVAATATSGAQPSNPLTGVWYAVAEDGSHPTTIVFGEGRANDMPFVVVDTITVGCPGGPEVLVGTARLVGGEVQFRDATRYCNDGSSFLNGPYEFPYGNGELTDAIPGGVRTVYQKICPNETRGDFTDAIPSYIVGTAGPDDLIGTAGPDVIDALAGNDTVRAGNGNDIICGGPGNDVIVGGAGIDIIWGDRGNDLISGGSGIDVIYGGAGRDRISGGSGADVLFGAGAGDTVRGGTGNDLLFGGLGNDTLLGQGGRDTADGGGGRDRCVAEVRRNCER